ncbi:hypothetical protein GS464_29530 [Rhodococcus hoagii]|nr:hypothetical protein [Prescottella equi]
MSLTLTFTDEEELDLHLLYTRVAEGGEDGARAEAEIVTYLSGKLGWEIENPTDLKEVM